MCKYFKTVAFFQTGLLFLQSGICLVTHCEPEIWNVAIKVCHFTGLL